MGMGGAMAVVKALEAAGPQLTRERFLAELNKIRDFETDVLAGPISFSPQDHAGVKSGGMATLTKSKSVVVLKSLREKR
jgi:branched-chain amino acid transport system substrate-binding protein